MTFSIYVPFVQHDIEKIKSLMKLESTSLFCSTSYVSYFTLNRHIQIGIFLFSKLGKLAL